MSLGLMAAAFDMNKCFPFAGVRGRDFFDSQQRRRSKLGKTQRLHYVDPHEIRTVRSKTAGPGVQSDRHPTFGADILTGWRPNCRKSIASPLVSGSMRSRNQSQLVQLSRRSSSLWF
jgi:hypothetical protein